MFFINSFLYSQTKESTDSISIIPILRILISKKTNIKALYFTESNKLATTMVKLNHQNYNLGKIYYDLNKYSDARRFYRSISLFEGLTPTVQSANNYYYLSSTNIGKKNYKAAEASLNKALSIYNRIKYGSMMI
jgi:tetratricopeptide (TPR) repeat protein